MKTKQQQQHHRSDDWRRTTAHLSPRSRLPKHAAHCAVSQAGVHHTEPRDGGARGGQRPPNGAERGRGEAHLRAAGIRHVPADETATQTPVNGDTPCEIKSCSTRSPPSPPFSAVMPGEQVWRFPKRSHRHRLFSSSQTSISDQFLHQQEAETGVFIQKFMNKQQKPVLTGQRFKTRKRDEKEKFEPTVFRDTIIQGLNEAGSDLDAVAKFLDVTGSRLDYRRYADTLFDILIAGSMLAPGGTRMDDGDRSKVTEHCVFAAAESHTAVRGYAQVFNKLIRRYKYLEKAFEEEIKKLLLFLKAFNESEQTRLAALTGILLAHGTLPATILTSLFSDNLVKEGVILRSFNNCTIRLIVGTAEEYSTVKTLCCSFFLLFSTEITHSCFFRRAKIMSFNFAGCKTTASSVLDLESSNVFVSERLFCLFVYFGQVVVLVQSLMVSFHCIDAESLWPAKSLQKMQCLDLVMGISASFAVKLFKAWMAEKDANAVTSALRKANLDKKLLELFPANKQNVEHFTKYFNDEGLKELSDFLRVQQSLGTRKELQKDLQERLSQECPIREMVLYLKEEMKKNELQEQAVIGLLWTCVMNAVEWNKKEELVTEQALKHLKHYAPLLAVFSTQGQSELILLQKIQEYCYDNIQFMKSFHKIVVLFYKADVLSEEAILKCFGSCRASEKYKWSILFIVLTEQLQQMGGFGAAVDSKLRVIFLSS
ncbi:BZW2 protein, partial [Atractosteus spatula]|nr:BZW2 protein [Atractosteus spatula]